MTEQRFPIRFPSVEPPEFYVVGRYEGRVSLVGHGQEVLLTPEAAEALAHALRSVAAGIQSDHG